MKTTRNVVIWSGIEKAAHSPDLLPRWARRELDKRKFRATKAVIQQAGTLRNNDAVDLYAWDARGHTILIEWP